ncbi:MAG: hypothetical protein K6A32_03585 [Bacteroidales bacterium]|nr:hypothetical protein [Bacteroidales bacterium]
MQPKDYISHDEERIDALDHLIFRELGQQAQWQQTMAMWNQRARQQRRLRFIPVLSNIASVAALFILGLILEAAVPGIGVSDSLVPAKPAIEQSLTPSSTASPGNPSASSTILSDSLANDTL